jgi:hypothetical protein
MARRQSAAALVTRLVEETRSAIASLQA